MKVNKVLIKYPVHVTRKILIQIFLGITMWDGEYGILSFSDSNKSSCEFISKDMQSKSQTAGSE